MLQTPETSAVAVTGFSLEDFLFKDPNFVSEISFSFTELKTHFGEVVNDIHDKDSVRYAIFSGVLSFSEEENSAIWTVAGKFVVSDEIAVSVTGNSILFVENESVSAVPNISEDFDELSVCFETITGTWVGNESQALTVHFGELDNETADVHSNFSEILDEIEPSTLLGELTIGFGDNRLTGLGVLGDTGNLEGSDLETNPAFLGGLDRNAFDTLGDNELELFVLKNKQLRLAG